MTVRFAVDREAFDVDVDNSSHVAIFERIGNESTDGTGWGDANATLVNETNESYVFEVTTDHPTTYVVGALLLAGLAGTAAWVRTYRDISLPWDGREAGDDPPERPFPDVFTG